jgi:acetyl-CoA synthetase
MAMTNVYRVSEVAARTAGIDKETYDATWRRSITDTEAYWAEQAGCIDWTRKFSKVKDVSWGR